MNSLPQHFVYRQDVIDFLTVSVQVCRFLEKIAEEDKRESVDKLTCLLPMLYLKTRMLDKPEQELDGYVETFCSEGQYDEVRSAVAALLGSDDTYLEMPVEEGLYGDLPETRFISEQLADIYQELFDLAANYRTQETAVMNDAILACLEAFELHWGQKLLSVLRALDVLRNDPEFSNSED